MVFLICLLHLRLKHVTGAGVPVDRFRPLCMVLRAKVHIKALCLTDRSQRAHIDMMLMQCSRSVFTVIMPELHA